MASKKQILKKIKILITQRFANPEEAFGFFDKDGDTYLDQKELKQLIADAEVNSFLSGIVAKKLIAGLDTDADKRFNWREFRKAMNKLLIEAA